MQLFFLLIIFGKNNSEIITNFTQHINDTMNIQSNISLKEFNTFRIKVHAKYFVEINSAEELKHLINMPLFKSERRLILGGGSNLLLTDNFDGLVIKISIPGIEIIHEDNENVVIRAGAGVIWHELVLYCVEKNYGGIENMSLIPGNVGAAPIQNIGAYGQELKDVFLSLEGIYIDSGKTVSFNSDECIFLYRESIFKSKLKNKFIITSLTIRLSKFPKLNIEYGSVKKELEKLGKENITIKDVSDVITAIRKSKLPDPAEIGNAGSFFKNPEINIEHFDKLKEKFPGIIAFDSPDGKKKIAAGWMIEQCGWKGKKIGNTGVHKNHALVLVNFGRASGKEILILAEEIKKSVSDKFGVELQEEINIV